MSKNLSSRIIYAIIALFIAGIITGVIIAFKLLYKQDLTVMSFIPEKTQILVNFNIESEIIRLLYKDQYEKAMADPGTEETMNSLSLLFMNKLFLVPFIEKVNIREDFLKYLEPEICLAFFNIGKSLALRIPPNKVKESLQYNDIQRLGVFRISDRKKVEEFFRKLEERCDIKKETLNGYSMFVSEKFSYVFKEDFLLLSNSPETLLLSLRTVSGKEKNIEENDKYSLFKSKISSDTVGSAFINLNYLREDFYSEIELPEDSIVAGFFDSFKLAGTGFSVSEKGLLFETLILPEERLSPLAEEFFSQKSVVPEPLNRFSMENTHDILVLTDVSVPLKILKSFFEEVMPDVMDKISNFTINSFNLDIERDIMEALRGDLAISLPAKSLGEIGTGITIDYGRLFSDSILMVGIKEGSRLEGLISGSDFIMTLFSKPASFNGVNIVNTPDGNFCYALTENYLIISYGKTHDRIEDCIKAKQGIVTPLYSLYEKRGEGIFPVESTGVFYINMKDFYEKFFRGIMSQKDIDRGPLKNLPELWLTSTTVDKEFKTIVYIPLVF